MRAHGLSLSQALFKARELDAQSSALFNRIVDFASKSATLGSDQPVVREVIQSELPSLLEGQSLSEFVLAASRRVKQDPLSNLSTRIEVAKALVKTDTAPVSDAASIIVDDGLSGRGVTVISCREALDTLKGFGGEAGGATAAWITKVTERFPLLKNFN